MLAGLEMGGYISVLFDKRFPLLVYYSLVLWLIVLPLRMPVTWDEKQDDLEITGINFE